MGSTINRSNRDSKCQACLYAARALRVRSRKLGQTAPCVAVKRALSSLPNHQISKSFGKNGEAKFSACLAMSGRYIFSPSVLTWRFHRSQCLNEVVDHGEFGTG